MNLQEVKNQFPEAVGEIETLERLGFASCSGNWIDTLDFETAQTIGNAIFLQCLSF